MRKSIPNAETQFVVYLKKLRNELDTAYTHYEIAKTLRTFRVERHADFSEAITFFQETINANLFSTIMTICRFMDTSSDCLQLNAFFKLLRNNLEIFSNEAYKKRLLDKGTNSGDLKHWVNIHLEITQKIVDDDEVKFKNLPVTNIRKWRNKKLAHIDKKRAISNSDIMKTNPVTVKEIDDILITLNDVLNRYSSSFDGVTHVIGLPPVKYQMEYIMDALSTYRKSRKIR
jgi:hypothetical protein